MQKENFGISRKFKSDNQLSLRIIDYPELKQFFQESTGIIDYHLW